MTQAIQNAIDTRDALALRELALKTSNDQRMMLQFLAEIVEGERAFRGTGKYPAQKGTAY